MPLCCLSARKPGNHSSLDTDWFSSLWRAPCPQPSRAYLWLVPCYAHWGGLWIVLEENLWEAFGRFVFEGWTTSGVCQHSRQCLWAAKIPVRALLPQHQRTVRADWPVVFLSPKGHWAAAASWLQAWARWFWVLVCIPQRAAPEQGLRLPAPGKKGDLHRRQAQVPSCISFNKTLLKKEGWEGCRDQCLCPVLFSSLLFSNSYLM